MDEGLHGQQTVFRKRPLGVAQAVDQGKSAASFDTITELSVVQPGYDVCRPRCLLES